MHTIIAKVKRKVNTLCLKNLYFKRIFRKSKRKNIQTFYKRQLLKMSFIKDICDFVREILFSLYKTLFYKGLFKDRKSPLKRELFPTYKTCLRKVSFLLLLL